MAIALKAQGVGIRIVYLGHRYGSAVVVRKDGPVKTFADMKGRTIAVPSRFSDERLIVFRVLKKFGMKPEDLKIVEMAPPDVTGALAAGAIDAFSMGEPFPSQAELGGYGRVLFHAREYWPDYMSCVLVVREDVISSRPEAVQTLVDGIATGPFDVVLDSMRPEPFLLGQVHTTAGSTFYDVWASYKIADIVPMAMYSDMKNSANFIDEYSV